MRVLIVCGMIHTILIHVIDTGKVFFFIVFIVIIVNNNGDNICIVRLLLNISSKLFSVRRATVSGLRYLIDRYIIWKKYVLNGRISSV